MIEVNEGQVQGGKKFNSESGGDNDFQLLEKSKPKKKTPEQKERKGIQEKMRSQRK